MKILVINGPNLNMLGRREKSLYGSMGLPEIEEQVRAKAEEMGVEVELFQSNHEGDLVDHLQAKAPSASGIIINAGALTHYGLSLRDALVDTRLPIVEMHLSNVHGREEFRRRSVIADVSVGEIAGLGWRGYLYALEALVERLRKEV